MIINKHLILKYFGLVKWSNLKGLVINTMKAFIYLLAFLVNLVIVITLYFAFLSLSQSWKYCTTVYEYPFKCRWNRNEKPHVNFTSQTLDSRIYLKQKSDVSEKSNLYSYNEIEFYWKDTDRDLAYSSGLARNALSSLRFAIACDKYIPP